ncbi:primosomal protein N' [Desulfovibrio sp. OttesenSCG-928-F20]|nr:primosomal protein N' [Desulfovibrio sp. OttesenSCG-928-F20]
MNDSLARVAILSPPYSTLTYSLPEYFPAASFFTGQRVAVPLGQGLRLGVVTAFGDEEEKLEAGFSLKAILWPLDREALLSTAYLDLAMQLAFRQNEEKGRILASMLPAGLRSVQTRLRFFGPGKPRELPLKALAALPEDELRGLAQLWLGGQAEVRHAQKQALDTELCLLASDPPWPLRPAATAQNAMLEYLLEHGCVTRRKLYEALGKGASATLATLAGRDLVRIRPADFFENSDEAADYTEISETAPPIAPPMTCRGKATDSPFQLTRSQQDVLAKLQEAARGDTAQSHLLFGITGSGKTAIYLELARQVLGLGRSVMLLAPEVALALKLWGDVKAFLPPEVLAACEPVLYHGYQGQARRERIFRRLADSAHNAPVLIVGTRSALLLPLENIGLIVLDEEHDASFKQDEGFVYQAKEVAWYRASQQKALLLLGSATPDVKTFYAARQGLIPLHVLSDRVGGGGLPDIELVRLEGGKGASSLLAAGSVEALTRTIERGEQAVILLNRRGYAPVMYCLACKTTARCPHCDIALAYHKGRERLVCHYCGYSTPYPCACTACKNMNFLPMGQGTEKLEESLGPLLPPGAGILRLDRDSARRPGRMEEILASFARREAQVLVGTQMLSKGHHFPDVTLAIVADADLGLNLPDYRAAERTFQLLVQSAGRSGRGEKAGKVLIQTRDPGHYCWDFVRRADYEGFYEQELALRKRRYYPPFVRLGLIRISHAMNLENGPELVAALGQALRQEARSLGVTLLGPAPAPLPFLQGRRRWHCLLKSMDWPALRALFDQARALADKKNLRLRLDLDPLNML